MRFDNILADVMWEEKIKFFGQKYKVIDCFL